MLTTADTMSNEIKPVAWTARSWLASKSGGHFVQDRRQSFDVPLYDQSAIDAAVAAERERCVRVLEAYQVPVGNSSAGEIAAELTMGALRDVRDAIRAAAAMGGSDE